MRQANDLEGENTMSKAALLLGLIIVVSVSISLIVVAAPPEPPLTGRVPEVPKFIARVKVDVSTKDALLANSVRSYIKRELRSLHDVQLVDKDAEWPIDIMALDNRLDTGYTSGSVLSFVFLLKIDPQWVIVHIPKADEEAKQLVSGALSEAYMGFRHGLFICGPDSESLKSICSKLVADFDTTCLEGARKALRRSIKSPKNTQEDDLP